VLVFAEDYRCKVAAEAKSSSNIDMVALVVPAATMTFFRVYLIRAIAVRYSESATPSFRSWLVNMSVARFNRG